MDLVPAPLWDESHIILAIPFRVVSALIVFHHNLPELKLGVFWEASLYCLTRSNLGESPRHSPGLTIFLVRLTLWLGVSYGKASVPDWMCNGNISRVGANLGPRARFDEGGAHCWETPASKTYLRGFDELAGSVPVDSQRDHLSAGEGRHMSTSRIDEQGLEEVVQTADVPLTAKRIAEAVLGSTRQKAAGEVEKVLERLQQFGRVHQFPPKQKGQAVRFASIPPAEWVERRILAKVTNGGGKVTEKQVREFLHKWELTIFDEAMGGLLRSGKLHCLTVRNKYVVSSAPTPFDYLLERQVASLKEILTRINRRRAKPLTFGELRAFLDGSSAQSNRRPVMTGELNEEMLRAWYDEDVPLRGGVTTVPIPWTWEHYVSWCKERGFRANLGQFHEFFRNLFLAHKIELIPHNRTHEIPPREAELALTSPGGEILYYWRWH